MFVAYDREKNRVDISEAKQGETYYCPVCGEIVKIRAVNSEYKRTHFAHVPGSLCYDNWQHDMSEWHYGWQSLFPIETREVVIEKDGIKHRADVCIGNTVIEFQHSRIENTEILERNRFYTSAGYKVIWLFDATDKLRNWLEDSNEKLDPLLVREDDLCWRRKTAQFTGRELTSNVSIYLQYRTTTCAKGYEGIPLDILIRLTRVEAKDIEFENTAPFYITPANFVKEYGGITPEGTLTVSEIESRSRQLKQQQRAAAQARQQAAIARAFNRSRRPTRRFRF